MTKLKEDKKTIAPYPNEFKTHQVRTLQSLNNSLNYLFEASVTGDKNGRAIYLTAGYPEKDNDHTEYTNTFIISIDALRELKDILIKVEKEYVKTVECDADIVDCYNELYSYIDAGIIKELKVEKIGDEYPNYSKELYIPFKITPVFIPDIATAKPDITVNIGFNFIDCFHIVPTEQGIFSFIQKLTNKNSLPIKFIGYDVKDEMQKYKDKLMQDLQKYNPNTARRKPTEEELEQARNTIDKMKKTMKSE